MALCIAPLAIVREMLQKNESFEKSQEKVMDLLKKYVNSGSRLVACLDYVKEKYPWTEDKVCIMTFVSVLELLLGWALYTGDVATDIYFFGMSGGGHGRQLL